jgi:hypothetical protein
MDSEYLDYLNRCIGNLTANVMGDIRRHSEDKDYCDERWKRFNEDIETVCNERNRLISLLSEIEQLQIFKTFIVPSGLLETGK